MMRSIMALFRSRANDAAGLYGALVGEARQPGWYVEGGVEDDIDGRFAVLASLTALAIVELEARGEQGVRASAALTEAFVADLEPQLREAGLGDPSLGKQVRKLVAALARRVEAFRAALAGEGEWGEAVRESVFRDQAPGEVAATWARERLRAFADHLGGLDEAALVAGRLP